MLEPSLQQKEQNSELMDSSAESAPHTDSITEVFITEDFTGTKDSSEEEVSPELSTATPVTAEEALVPLEIHQEVIQAREELLDLLLRRQAEFENLRRRTEREKTEFFEFALANFMLELLPILDGFDRGLNSPHGESVENYKSGMELLSKQFHSVLESAGLRRIETQEAVFDPNLHFAVMKEETLGIPDSQILQEYQPGYLFKDKLLRPAMVKVAVQPASQTATIEDEHETGSDPEC
jgi:molecular chaperone GrpE